MARPPRLEILGGIVDGRDEFIASMLERLESAPGIPRRYFRGPRPELPTLLAASDAGAAIASAHEHGYSLRQIARHLGVNPSTVSRRLQRQGALSRAATNGT